MLLSAALFSFADPAGDPRGDGRYVLPSRPPVSAEALDLRRFQAGAQGSGMRFTVDYGAVQNPWGLPSGFSAGVTDIFVKTGRGGLDTLSGLNLRAAGGRWQYHLRVSGAGATLEEVPEGSSTPIRLADPAVRRSGTSLVVDAAVPPGEYAYWVTSSVFSPLTPDGLLRPGTDAGPAQLQAPRANVPVPVDVLAPAGDLQAYVAGTLAAQGEVRDRRPLILTALGALGLVLTALATLLLWRRGA
ncbi:glucodextranase DOMON-like domain-containing protein [Deinococcus petrolearius]|uniref:Glucodextranase DOMON-like domain-containing protein n=1 Tax=Deinococcus petrolearius TaxID=1751295 RepID=A0ABW1DFM6_9DEIO